MNAQGTARPGGAEDPGDQEGWRAVVREGSR